MNRRFSFFSQKKGREKPLSEQDDKLSYDYTDKYICNGTIFYWWSAFCKSFYGGTSI